MNVAPPLSSAYPSDSEDSWGFSTSCQQLEDSAEVKEAVHNGEPREALIEKGVERMDHAHDEEGLYNLGSDQGNLSGRK